MAARSTGPAPSSSAACSMSIPATPFSAPLPATRCWPFRSTANNKAGRAAVSYCDQRAVMIHVGQNYSPQKAILALLNRGDIVTQMHAPGMNGILDDKGVLMPEVMAARRRGILFDFGNVVTDHCDWDTVEKATKQRL